jgi:hypothetical protein
MQSTTASIAPASTRRAAARPLLSLAPMATCPCNFRGQQWTHLRMCLRQRPCVCACASLYFAPAAGAKRSIALECPNDPDASACDLPGALAAARPLVVDQIFRRKLLFDSAEHRHRETTQGGVHQLLGCF